MASYESNFSVFIRNRGAVDSAKWMANRTEIVRVQATPPKRYTFDHVFDHTSTQQDVFEQCAEPLVEEFLHGYNTTIFAYGQTGTGKTYTMTGDCSELVSPMTDQPSLSMSRTSGLEVSFDFSAQACLSPNAGLVPRVLASIFSRLGRQDTQDWVLEMSFVELYNEELRDLLDLSCRNVDGDKLRVPQRAGRMLSSSSQAATNIVNDTAQGPNAQSRHRKFLKVVENKATRSVDVQGATNLVVDSLEYALKHVRMALKQRETASTSLNSDSSRSHTILTLVLVNKQRPQSNVAIRSKLNLVDLAGSENVLKSGAVNKRAKEAGEINKSLLALGRVIEKLVAAEERHRHQSGTSGNTSNSKSSISGTNAISNTSTSASISAQSSNKLGSSSRPGRPYISYRDSRLTHLLQDSLGGSTKTVMIATVDLGSLHSDDSRNTLEYASKAKSIRNQLQTEMDLMDLPTVLGGYQQKFIEYQNAFAIQQSREGVHISKEHYDSLRKDRKAAERLEVQVQSQIAEIEDLKRIVAEKTYLLDGHINRSSHQAMTITAQAREIEQLEAQLGSIKQIKVQSLAQTRSSEQIANIAETLEAQTRTYVTKVEYFHSAMSKKLADVPNDIRNIAQSIMDNSSFDSITSDMLPKLRDISQSQIAGSSDKLLSELVERIEQTWSENFKQLQNEIHSSLVEPTRDHVAEIQSLATRAAHAISQAINEVNARADRDRQFESIGNTLRHQNEETLNLLQHFTKLHSQHESVINDLLNSQSSSVASMPKILSNLHAAANDMDLTSNVAENTNGNLTTSTVTKFTDMSSKINIQPISENLVVQFGSLGAGVSSALDDAVSAYYKDTLEPKSSALKNANEQLEALNKIVSETKDETQRPSASARHFQRDIAIRLSELKDLNRPIENGDSLSCHNDRMVPPHVGPAYPSSSSSSIGSAVSSNGDSNTNSREPDTQNNSPLKSPLRSPQRRQLSPVRNIIYSPRLREGRLPIRGSADQISPSQSISEANPHSKVPVARTPLFGDLATSSNQRLAGRTTSESSNSNIFASAAPNLRHPNYSRSTTGILARRANSVQVPLQAKTSAFPQPAVLQHSLANNKRHAEMSPRKKDAAKTQQLRSTSSNLQQFAPNKRPRTNQSRS